VFLVIYDGSFLKGTLNGVYSHLWCVEKKIWLSLVLMLDVGDAVVCFLVAVLI